MIRAVVTFKAEILVDVTNGSLAEEAARIYLEQNPGVLKLTTLSCEATKIKRLLKSQGCSFNPSGGRLQ